MNDGCGDQLHTSASIAWTGHDWVGVRKAAGPGVNRYGPAGALVLLFDRYY